MLKRIMWKYTNSHFLHTDFDKPYIKIREHQTNKLLQKKKFNKVLPINHNKLFTRSQPREENLQCLHNFPEALQKNQKALQTFLHQKIQTSRQNIQKKGCEPKSAAFAYLCTLSSVLKAAFVMDKNQSSLSSPLSLA